MTAWANKEGWVVVWNTQVDYPIQVEFRIQDTFLNLVKKTIELYQKADKPLYAEAIPAQRLIVITSK
ncbi:TcpQ domain-containing protein [Plesiomonas shigelloides subsp. oncorhynchi]|nr:TcpQ domain-containing protein [Plesiomonas shigelloides]